MKKNLNKALALILAGLISTSMIACGNAGTDGKETGSGEQTTDSTPVSTEAVTTEAVTTEAVTEDVFDATTPAGMLYQSFKDKMAETPDISAIDMATHIASNENIPFGPVTMETENGTWLNGFEAETISGYAEGAVFAPMIGAIPFMGYIFKVAEGDDVNAFVQMLKDSANLRWNVCTEADELLVKSIDNTVFFVMAPATFEEEPIEDGMDELG